MSDTVKKIVGSALILVGAAAIGIFTGQWGLAGTLAVAGIGRIWQAGQAGSGRSLGSRQGAILENRTSARAGLPVIYGKTRIGPIIAEVRVDPASADRKRLVVVAAFAHGSQNGTGVQAIDEIWMDDRLAWTLAGGVQFPFNTSIGGDDTAGHQTQNLDVTIHLGLDAAVVDPKLTAIFPTEWPSTSAGKGIAYATLLMWYDTDIFPTTLPRINAVVRGQKTFDPRDASTIYNTNPALAIRDFLTSPIYGLGIPLTGEIDNTTFNSSADFADETVVPFSGQPAQKRFEVGGWVDTARSLRSTLADLTTSCRGTIINSGSQWKMYIRRAQLFSGLTVTTENTVEGSWQYVLPGVSEVANSVTVSYIDPDRNYQIDSVRWPEPDQSNEFLADDGNYEHERRMDLPFTDDRLRAQQIGMVLTREGREAIGVIVTGKEELFQAEHGDVVEVTQPSPGWSAKPFWVVATNYRPHEGVVDLILAEYEPAVYDLTDQFAQPTIDNTNLPNPFSIDPVTSLVLTATDAEALVLADGTRIPRIKVEWTNPVDAFLDHFFVQTKRTNDSPPDWDDFGTVAKDAPSFFVTPVSNGESWDVRIAAVNTLGVTSTFVQATVVVGAPADDPTAEKRRVIMKARAGKFTAFVITGSALSLKWEAGTSAWPVINGSATVESPSGFATFTDISRAYADTIYLTVEFFSAAGAGGVSLGVEHAFVRLEQEPGQFDEPTGKRRRSGQFDDNKYPVVASDTIGEIVDAAVKESGLKDINTLFSKGLPADPDDADSVDTGILNKSVPLSVINAADELAATLFGVRQEFIWQRAGDPAGDELREDYSQRGFGHNNAFGTAIVRVGRFYVDTSIGAPEEIRLEINSGANAWDMWAFGHIGDPNKGFAELRDGQLVAKRHDLGDRVTALVIDWRTGNSQRFRLTGNLTLTLNNPRAGACYVLEIARTGNFSVTWPSNVNWGTPGAPAQGTTSAHVDVFVFYYDGANHLGGPLVGNPY